MGKIFGPVRILKALTKALGWSGIVHIHHLIPKQIAHFFGFLPSQFDDILGVPILGIDHVNSGYSRALQAALEGATDQASAIRLLSGFYVKHNPSFLKALAMRYPQWFKFPWP